MNNIFTKSEKFKSEYCVRIIKVDILNPIEGSDFLVQAIVDGFSIVVRKDEVKVGDVLFYALNETQLNERFLSRNNLFEIGEREKNSNYEFVESLIADGKTDEAKSHVGFFNKHGRVKMIKLRGCPSMGFLFGVEAMGKWKSALNDINIDDLVGTEFDTVNGELFVKAYVPYIPERRTQTKGEKRNNKIKRFDRMIPGEFAFHYDTNQLNCNMHRIDPDDSVTISVKVHGTSNINANILIKKPLTLKPTQQLINKHCKYQVKKLIRNKPSNMHNYIRRGKKFNKMCSFYLSKIVPEYTVGYGNVYSSRTVIKNQYINAKVSKGYYNTDVWGEYNELIKKYIPKGMTIYSEIFGYVTGSQRMIQKGYDYGCPEGTNKMMPYRISTKEEGGKNREWSVLEVCEWTKKLIKDNPKLKEKIIPIPILYHGTLKELYPEIDTFTHWNENVLEAMKNDVEHFGMEKNEPMCKIKSPREGIVLRIDNDPINEAFKLKCTSFLMKESKMIDNGEVDIEMSEAY